MGKKTQTVGMFISVFLNHRDRQIASNCHLLLVSKQTSALGTKNDRKHE